MKIRLAKQSDIEVLKNLYKNVINKMYQQKIFIWDKVYPSETLVDDIQNKQLYVISKENKILGCFAMSKNLDSLLDFDWDKNSDCLYLSKIAVDINYQNQGVATKIINFAKSKAKNAIRLTVDISNVPAINFYKKIGFNKVNGFHIETYIERNLYIKEIAFELKV